MAVLELNCDKTLHTVVITRVMDHPCSIQQMILKTVDGKSGIVTHVGHIYRGFKR